MATVKTRKLPPSLILKNGGHKEADRQFCVMEAVAFVAGEKWSDSPKCACPVISSFLRSWNDSLPDDETRTRLLSPLIPKIVGTKSDAKSELARVMLVIDWIAREFTPAWMDLVPTLSGTASLLRSIKPIQSWEDVRSAVSPLRDAQEKSSAARSAARSAA